MTNNEDYYTGLSLPPVPASVTIRPINTSTQKPKYPKYQESEYEMQLRDIITEIDCDDLQKRLQCAMDKIVLSWTEKHDILIDTLDELERSKKRLDHRLHIQIQNYERALRESQLYKSRYESLQQRTATNNSNNLHNNQSNINYNNQRRRSLLLSSNTSCISGKSYLSSSSTRSSCSSSIRTSVSMVDEMIDPVLLDGQLLLSSDNDDTNNDEFDLYSVLSESDSCTLPNSPDVTPLMSPLSLTSPRADKEMPPSRKINPNASEVTITKQSTMDQVLTFACGDGFWNTIARGKNNKVEVDTLVSNYIRRGGNPNVAMNSDTVNNVKEGYGLIHALIVVKNTSALRKVLDAGAKTNVYPLTSKQEDRVTPTILAAKSGYTNGIRLLIQLGGIDILSERGPYGENVLHAAVQSGSDETAGYILRLTQNALLNKPDNNGATPLHYACITGKTRMATLFIKDYQGKPDPKDNKGETPLHYAVRNRKLKVITKLVGELGVYPNPYILKQVPTPLDLAKSGGLQSIINYLRSAGAKTTKEMEKTSRKTASFIHTPTTVHSSNSSTFSGESSGSADSIHGPSTAVLGVRQFLHTKTSQILRGTFDL